jgi:hypothetical protein
MLIIWKENKMKWNVVVVYVLHNKQIRKAFSVPQKEWHRWWFHSFYTTQYNTSIHSLPISFIANYPQINLLKERSFRVCEPVKEWASEKRW